MLQHWHFIIIFHGFFAGHANDCAGAKIMVLPEARQVELPDRILRCVGQRDWRGGAAGGDSSAQQQPIAVLTLRKNLAPHSIQYFEDVSESFCFIPLRFVRERRLRIMGGRGALKDEDQRSVLSLP